MPELTVLIVEDQAILRAVLKKYITQAGHQVIAAASGTDAIQQLAHLSNIDIIILDVNMPRLTGIQTAQQIRQMAPYVTVPILFCTANTADNLEIPDSIKPYQILFKPFQQKEVLASLEQSLKTTT